MNHRINSFSVAALLVLLTACPGDLETDRAARAPGAESETDAPEAVCLRGEPFLERGVLPLETDAEPSDAERLAAIRWSSHEGCERIVLDIEDDAGSPAAQPGRVRAVVMRDLGIVRISLREVEWVASDATEADFGGDYARAAYATFSEEGRWVDVDIHMADAVEAHAARLSEPARVVIDLRPGGEPVPPPPAEHDRVVVLDPRSDTRQSYPLTIVGYARTFEANVVARIERDGEQVLEDFTTATAWADAWGRFTITFEEGPAGAIVLHVGEHSARDGTWEGVAIELEMR